jgi:hypothetical protein
VPVVRCTRKTNRFDRRSCSEKRSVRSQSVRRWLAAGIVLVFAVAEVPAANATRARHCPRVVVRANPPMISYGIKTYVVGCHEARAAVRQYMLARLHSSRCRFRADTSPYRGCRVQDGFACELAGVPGRTSAPEECLRVGRSGASIFFRTKRPRA